MTTVKTLLGLPGLRLRPRAGTDLLDRPVTRIYVTELSDPGRYLSAGELVLSGLLWWREPGDAEPFVAALARSGAAALAASGADSDGIPDDVVEACERHRIPLLEVPIDLSFSVVTEQVVLALAAASDGARKRLQAAADAPVETLLERASTELGLPCWVLSGLGRVVAGVTPLPMPVEEVVRRYAGQEPGPLTLLPVEGGHAVPWLIAVGGALSTAQAELAEELAGLVGVTRARAARPEGELPGEVRVVALRTEGSDESRDVLRELLPGGLLLESAGETSFAATAHWPTEAATELSTVEPLLRAKRILCGVSAPAPRDEAWATARYTLEVAARRAGRVTVVPSNEVDAHTLLLAGAPAGVRAALRRRVLGPLLEYDAEQHTDLVHTVRVFLECSGSPTRAAKALHVHVNTLRYRIGRAGELLGADLTEFTDQLDVYLALRAGDQPG
ncbi:PucR family transcriptional regulator ligand-binding domain-containing protein [Amycolatopsis sp., V23-08]|uniref:PucR family transcriptional regulator ligand-binding domain-containing protein n=1 Tax=Amycolatopsis heterodermiae TaxID=3110235 RepID=A0ABU5RCN7_9PSEU|nr:PucR family transcriptional regulator ligand-binding domain-containing protein [Amycolatopsis sp., V23-08]MEA5363903.1 PucR family transcriptional regulator ligand-binding domain-containing protein [Amycolatopsis sp., V23-08]